MLRELDQRLQFGPGMRAERLTEAGFLIAAFFTEDVRYAYVPFVLSVLQAISGRFAPVALLVAALVPRRPERRLGDLYFDLGGTRGACAISALVQAIGIWLVHSNHDLIGFLTLTMPTASFVLSPTVGFCCGCALYVGMRNLLVKLGLTKRYANGACDINIEGTQAARHQ
ncbi:MAG: DUF4395 family protein [Deltaproteobacteria bacterium]|nr:DUF4395 family protein [Deltaproteobacteria bacterium]